MPTSIPKPTSRIQYFFPDAGLIILIGIGFLDLLSTAIWHSKGQIVELNPLLSPIIERSEWLFAAVKGSTLLAAYFAMIAYAQKKPEFVRKASRIGIVLYVGIYVIWFFGAM
jgi:hypothetical protein